MQKKVEYIVQEIFAKMVMYNFCSIITSHVVIQKKQRRHCYQVNFSKAISICKKYFKTWNIHPPNVEALIQEYILPIRNGRSSPRNIKSRTFVSFNYGIAKIFYRSKNKADFIRLFVMPENQLAV